MTDRELIAQAEALEQFAAQVDIAPDAVTPRLLSIALKQTARTYRAQAAAQPPASSCIGNDPLCPCQDGLACHYRNYGKTKAMPAQPPAEPVAQVVSSGHWELPCLQWMSADHSFRAPIGTKLYTHPDPRIAEYRALLEIVLDEYRRHGWLYTTDKRIEATLAKEG